MTKVQSVGDYTEPRTLRKPQCLPNAFVLNTWTGPPGATVVLAVFSLSHRDTVIGARPGGLYPVVGNTLGFMPGPEINPR